MIINSLVNVIGVLIYIFLVAQILQNAPNWFGKMNNILGGMALLLLFTLSAAVVGGLVLGKPIYLFFNGRKKESVKMVLYTIGWLFALTVVIFLILLLI